MIQFSGRSWPSCNRSTLRVETRRTPGSKTGAIVTKDEIIQMTIQAMGLDNSPLTPENEEYRAVVEATLMERLPLGTNFKTCKDFEHFAVGCCEYCHSIYEHYEMELEDLPSGEKAWICCSLHSALFESAKGMDQSQEEVDLEHFLELDDRTAADLDALAPMRDEDINLKDMPVITDFSGVKRITDYDNLQQGDGMHNELITHTCGHDRTYSRPSVEALKFVAESAKTTLCWDCWKLARAGGER
jgi:hypothetical protein